MLRNWRIWLAALQTAAALVALAERRSAGEEPFQSRPELSAPRGSSFKSQSSLTPQAYGASGWYTVLPLRAVDDARLGKTLCELDSQLPAGHIYRDPDAVTWAHETTHGINSRLRQEFSTPGLNAFYVAGGKALVLREPRFHKRDVAALVPPALRGRCFGLYLAGQQEWDDCPLYLVDEWVAYTNGALVGLELRHAGLQSELENSVEFAAYAWTLLKAIETHDPQYADRELLEQFVAWNARRIGMLIAASGIRPAAMASVAQYCGNGQCFSGFGGSAQPSGWQQPQRIVTRPVVPSPPGPRGPARPAACGAGCSCDLASLQTQLVSIQSQIKQLQSQAASSGPAGPAGPAGPPGPPGMRGAVGPAGSVDPATVKKSLASVCLPVEILDAKGAIITKVEIPLDGAHPLRLQLVPKK